MRHGHQQRTGRARALGGFALRGRRTASGLATAEGAVAGRAGAAGTTALGAPLWRGGRRTSRPRRSSGGTTGHVGAHQDPVRALREQYRDHPSWSAQLHHDNLHVRVDADLSVGPMPSYATLTRMMRSLGLVRQRRRLHYEPERPATDSREVLSYEVSRSHALWHALCGGRRHAAANPEPRGQQGIPTRGRNIILDTDSRSMIVPSRSRRHDHVREFVRAAAHN